MSVFKSTGDFLTLFQGDPKYKVNTLVKEPELQKRIDPLNKDYDAIKSEQTKAFDDFVSQFEADTGSARKLSGQEKGGLDRYWSLNGMGLMPEQQDWLTRYGVATRTGTDLGNAYALKNLNLSRVGGSGTGDSWTTRALAGDAAARETQNLLGLLAAEQAMRDRNEGIKIGSVGARQAIQDALLRRTQMPAQLAQQNFGWNTGALAGLLGLNAANKFYGVSQDLSGLDKAINFLNAQQNNLNSDIGMATNLLGAFMGGGGGGQASQQAPVTTSATSWSPGGSPAMNPPGGGWSLPSAGNMGAYYGGFAAPPGMPAWGNFWPSVAGVGSGMGWG